MLAATGCEVEIEWNKIDGVDPDTVPAGHSLTSYTDVATNSLLAEAMRANMVKMGKTYRPREVEATMATGSTDMGNVSHVVPAIHPMFGIETLFGNHHPSFTDYSNRPQNHEVARLVGTGMAQTIIDALTDEIMVAAALEEFERVHADGGGPAAVREGSL